MLPLACPAFIPNRDLKAACFDDVLKRKYDYIRFGHFLCILLIGIY